MESTATRFDVEKIRGDFPILSRLIVCKPLVYLDNAATSQKPLAVIDAVKRYYEDINANIHRGVHHLSVQATEAYELARDKVRDFLGAADRAEIVFTRGATESINLVAQAFLRPRLNEGDEILITHIEHHSNIVPWQILCGQTGALLRVAPVLDSTELDLGAFAGMLSERTKLAAIGHVSNAFGTIHPVEKVIALCKERNIPVLLDGAQAVPHMPVDVSALDCDFYVFSGHKAFAPTGIGALHAKRGHLETMEPYQGGGEMIRSVRFDQTTYNDVPHKFEAGTPNIAGSIGLGAAIDYLGGLDSAAVMAHEHDLLAYATEALSDLPGTRIIGTTPNKASVVSFTMEHAHPHDIGTILDQEGVAIRAGHHCAQPAMERFGVAATARASFAFYNTRTEIDTLVTGLELVRKLFH